MKGIEGDLIQLAEQGKFDVIIHCCNCQCQMGKGIALTIKNKYLAAYQVDCATEKASREKLGTYSSASVSSAQFHWRGDGVNADYDAIRSVMAKIKKDFSGKRIGYPLIGAGLAGGDWSMISEIINSELKGEDHTLVRFKP